MSGKTQVSDCTSSTVLHHTCVLIAQYHENKLLCYNQLKAVRIEFFFILKVANIRCFILIAVEIFHNIIRK
jgi:hypothetical protein